MLRHHRLSAALGAVLAILAGVSITLGQTTDPFPPLEFHPEPPQGSSPDAELEAQLATAKAQQEAADQRTNELNTAITEQETELKNLRADVAPPKPSSFTQLEQLRDQLALEMSRSEMLETAIVTQQESLEHCKAAWEEKERSRRQAKEALESGAPQENLGSALAIAELESQLASSRLDICRAGHEHARLELKLHELRVAYLKEKISRVSRNVTFSEADRAAPLAELEKQEDNLKRTRDSVQADIAVQQQAWFAARQRLAQTASPELAEQEEAYRLAFQSQQQRLAIIDQRLNRIAGVKKAWDQRFQVSDGKVDLATLKEWRQDTLAALSQLGRETRGQISRLADVRRQIATLSDEIEAGQDDPPEAIQWRNEQLAQLEKLARTYQRELDNLDNSRRLYDKLRADIAARGAGATAGERLEAFWDQIVRLWNYEIVAVDEQQITPHKIFKGILVLVIGFWVARWLAGLFGRRFLIRVGVHPSGASAIQSVMFYFLVCLMALLALHMANVPLTAFTILGGAVALGVGFGSQNIINNFISGLILLAERPIRVGDMIEVDGLHATVDRIGARSTCVVTSANVEIIVPNSKFLENNVVNWTLSNDRMRTFVSVGVAYESSIDKVTQILLGVAAENPHVLPNSESVVLFKEFGDNALMFELHFWIASRSNFERLRFQSEIRYQIFHVFKKQGISIAFPQSDVHLETTRPLEVRMVAENAAPTDNGAATNAATRR